MTRKRRGKADPALMIARAEVPKHIVEAIERAWPDGVVEMIDLDEAPFWDTYPGLRARLSRVPGGDLGYEREPKTVSSGASKEKGGSAIRSQYLWRRRSPSSP